MLIQAFAYLNIDHPMVAWGVYRGVLVSAHVGTDPQTLPVSLMFAGIVHHQNNARLHNELMIEERRAKKFPTCVSRLTGMFFFTELFQAYAAQAWGGHFRHDYLADLEVDTVGEVTQVDANWITYAKTDKSGRLNPSDLTWIDNYWSGLPYNDSPVGETIAHGRAIVLGTDLRNRAYEVIAHRFPNCLSE